jgi:hypothetical protein
MPEHSEKAGNIGTPVSASAASHRFGRWSARLWNGHSVVDFRRARSASAQRARRHLRDRRLGGQKLSGDFGNREFAVPDGGPDTRHGERAIRPNQLDIAPLERIRPLRDSERHSRRVILDRLGDASWRCGPRFRSRPPWSLRRSATSAPSIRPRSKSTFATASMATRLASRARRQAAALRRPSVRSHQGRPPRRASRRQRSLPELPSIQLSITRSTWTRRQSISYSRSTTGGRLKCQVKPLRNTPRRPSSLSSTENTFCTV